MSPEKQSKKGEVREMLQKGKSKRSETESFNDSSLLTLKKEGVMSQGM